MNSSRARLSSGALYVAIGSSYAAGPGIPKQLGPCGRSDHNYPHLVAAALHLHLVDVSCSGAVTADALTDRQQGNPPQIQAVSKDTALVTITIGGNDVGYIATAFGCGGLTSAACSSRSDAAFRALPASLSTLISQVRTRAPAAVIVLVTYPRLVPPTACSKLHYSSAGTALVGSLGQRLEGVFGHVAKQAGVKLADPYVLGGAHGPCAAPDERWVDGRSAPDAFPYHPTAQGHAEMAKLVLQAVGAG